MGGGLCRPGLTLEQPLSLMKLTALSISFEPLECEKRKDRWNEKGKIGKKRNRKRRKSQEMLFHFSRVRIPGVRPPGRRWRHTMTLMTSIVCRLLRA